MAATYLAVCYLLSHSMGGIELQEMVTISIKHIVDKQIYVVSFVLVDKSSEMSCASEGWMTSFLHG